MPLVSIYMPTKNRNAMLNTAISSCLSQTFKDFELIVVDDCSTDETENVVCQACSKDKRVKYIRMEQSVGANKCRNTAIFSSNSKFITGLDDDDYFKPERLSLLLDAIRTHRVSLVSDSHYDLFKYGIKVKSKVKERVIDFHKMKQGNLVGNQALMLTEKCREITGFDENLKAWQDYDMFYRYINKFGKAIKLDCGSMVVNRVRSRKGISMSSPFEGYNGFIKKHKLSLEKNEIHDLWVKALYNSEQKVFLKEMYKASNGAGIYMKLISKIVRRLIT